MLYLESFWHTGDLESVIFFFGFLKATVMYEFWCLYQKGIVNYILMSILGNSNLKNLWLFIMQQKSQRTLIKFEKQYMIFQEPIQKFWKRGRWFQAIIWPFFGKILHKINKSTVFCFLTKGVSNPGPLTDLYFNLLKKTMTVYEKSSYQNFCS